MRAKEFIMNMFEGKQKGTYAAVKFSETVTSSVKNFITTNAIPNPTPTNKLHCTLLYSRKHLPEYKALGKLDEPLTGTFTKYDVWPGQPAEDGHKPNCLVMEFDCPELTARHKELMEEHGATYDFPKYKTHITLSYDIGDMDIKQLPEFNTTIEVVEEYSEDLNLGWAQDNAKEEITEAAKEMPFAEVIELFKKEHADKIKQGCIRHQCHRAAGYFFMFAKSHGYTARSVDGLFTVDKALYDNGDFYDEEIVQMQDEGYDPDSLEDRKKFAHKHELVDELKIIPHTWNEYKGKIIDFTGHAQFVDSGLAADTNKKRYSKR